LRSKTIFLLPVLLLLAIAPAPAHAELLKLSLLRKSAPGFSIRSDIFQAGGGSAQVDAALPAGQAESLQRSIAEEIAQSVTYEGFILKNAKRLALLNVSGDFFSVGEGDMVLNKIKVVKIAQEKVTIDYDGQEYEIFIKGEQNG
jgi:hypothetical protein